jgi:hypothetical protein
MIPGDRTGYQHLAGIARDHGGQHLLQQVDRPGDVRVDDVTPLRGVLFQEGMAEAVTGVGAEEVDLPAAGGTQQLVHPLECRKVDFERVHIDTQALQARGRIDERRVGHHQQVVTVFRRKLGEFQADAGGGAGDDREFVSHGSSPIPPRRRSRA